MCRMGEAIWVGEMGRLASDDTACSHCCRSGRSNTLISSIRAWNLWSDGDWGGFFARWGRASRHRNSLDDSWVDHGTMIQVLRYPEFNNVLRIGTLENRSAIAARYLRLSVTCDEYQYAVFSEIEIE